MLPAQQSVNFVDQPVQQGVIFSVNLFFFVALSGNACTYIYLT